MRVIDLLVKISKGEEVPKKIHYGLYDYKLVEYNKTTKLYQCLSEPFELIDIKTNCLNDEVEIIEEDKKKEFNLPLDRIDINYFTNIKKTEKQLYLATKINTIIDTLNSWYRE